MKILIYGINFNPELTGIGKYTGEMVDWLAAQNNECRVITAPPYYPAWKIGKGYSSCHYKKENKKNHIVYRCPLWVPRAPKTISRLVHLLSFSFSSFPVLFKQITWKPDIIICIAPSFFCAPQAVLFSKLTRSKSWLHFQDFEICAMFETGMMSSFKKLNTFAHSIQSFITRRFDIVSTISHTMVQSANKKRVSFSPVTLFPNWVDINFIRPDANRQTYRKKWKINDDCKIILYSGNIGKKQSLELLVEAAVLLKHRNDIKFIIVGNGAFKKDLQQQASEKSLQNIFFKQLQPYELLPDLLKCADIHLILQKKGTKDSFLPSKLTSILSVGGHSIITAEKGTELYHIVKSNPGIATVIPPEKPEILASEIVGLLQKDTSKYNAPARKYAEQKLEKDAVLSNFEKQLQTLVNIP